MASEKEMENDSKEHKACSSCPPDELIKLMEERFDLFLPKENIAKSIMVLNPQVRRIAAASSFIVDPDRFGPFASFKRGYKAIYEEKYYDEMSFYRIYSCEIQDLLSVSSSLAVIGKYNIAYSLLRNAIDSIHSAIFFNYIATHMKEEFRNNFKSVVLSKIRNANDGRNRTFFEKKYTSDEAEDISMNTWLIHDYLDDVQISAKDGFEQFIEWGLVKPIPGNKKEITKYIRWDFLCSNIHENLEDTDIMRSYNLRKSETRFLIGADTPIIKEELTKYASLFCKIIDYHNVLILNHVHKLAGPRFVWKNTVLKEGDFICANLQYTHQLIKNLSKSSTTQ